MHARDLSHFVLKMIVSVFHQCTHCLWLIVSGVSLKIDFKEDLVNGG